MAIDIEKYKLKEGDLEKYKLDATAESTPYVIPPAERQSFFKGEITGQPVETGFVGGLFQRTLGSKGLLGAFQQPGRVAAAYLKTKDQMMLEDARKKEMELTEQMLNRMKSESGEEKEKFRRKVIKSIGESSLLSLASQEVERNILTPREAVSTTLRAGAMVAPGAAGIKGVGAGAIAGRIGMGGVVGGAFGAAEPIETGAGVGEIAKGAAIGAGIGVATAGVFEGLGGMWRAVSRGLKLPRKAGFVYSKELQPPIREGAKNIERGFDTLGKQIANVVDDQGKPVYVAKYRTFFKGKGGGYDQLREIAKRELKTNGDDLLKELNKYPDIAISKEEVAGNITRNMENYYGQLKPTQVKAIQFEVNRMPETMGLVDLLKQKRMYDKLIPQSFWAKIGDPNTSFPSLIKYTLRDNARAIINEKTGTPLVQRLNNNMSIAMDVNKLASYQIMFRGQFKAAKTGGGFFIMRLVADIIDDKILNPMLTTQYAQALTKVGMKVGQTLPRQVGRAVTTEAVREKITE